MALASPGVGNMEQVLEKRREIEKNRELENENDCQRKVSVNEETCNIKHKDHFLGNVLNKTKMIGLKKI